MWKEQYPNLCVVLGKSSLLYLARAVKVPRVTRGDHWWGGSRMLARALLMCSHSKILPKIFLLSCPVIVLQTKYECFNSMIIWWNKIVHILNHAYNTRLLTPSALVATLSSMFKSHVPTTRWCWSYASEVGPQSTDRSKMRLYFTQRSRLQLQRTHAPQKWP